MTGRPAAFFLAPVLLLTPAFAAADKKPRPANARAPQAGRAVAKAESRSNSGQPGRSGQQPKPGPRKLEKLLEMSPSEREKALAALPPARRESIERRIDEIEKLPPAQQNRVRTRLELLSSLPPGRQNQVRHSIRQFQEMPEDRQALLKQELSRMTRMPEEERRARMNSEEFRNRYSASEQQMMGNLMEIQPQP